MNHIFQINLLAVWIFLAAHAWLVPAVSAQSVYTPYTFSTLAGVAPSAGSADGTGSAARLSFPHGVAVDGNGNLYVADSSNHTIRKVTPDGEVTTLAGQAGSPGSADGTGNDARFSGPYGVTVDSAGNVYVADFANKTIRKVTAAGVVTTLAGVAREYGEADGTRSAARFSVPSGVAVDTNGNVYVADRQNNTIRKVTAAGVVTTLAGHAPGPYSADGTGSAARFNNPSGVTVDSAGNIYVADAYNHTIRKVTAAGVVTSLAGNAAITDQFGYPAGGYADGMGTAARFNNPSGVAVDTNGNIYVADTYNSTIRKVTPDGEVTTLAGLAGNPGSADGTGNDARFGSAFYGGLLGVAVDSAGNVFVADTGNQTIRKVTPEGVVTTLAGLAGNPDRADGTGSVARFSYPQGVAVDINGNVYVADSNNHAIRKVTAAGVVTTVAGLLGPLNFVTWGTADGTGSAARFNYPSSVALDNSGNIYVADRNNATIRKVTTAGVVTTLAGLANVVTPQGLTGSFGSADGTGSAARFGGSFFDGWCCYGMTGVAVDSAGNVYVADTVNNTIRKGFPAPTIVTSGSGFGFSGGHFGFALTGPAGQLVVVEASTDLVNWLPIWTNTFVGALHFTDPQSGGSSHRFYRTRLP